MRTLNHTSLLLAILVVVGVACNDETLENEAANACSPKCLDGKVVQCDEDGAEQVTEDCAAQDATCESGRCVVRPPGLMPSSPTGTGNNNGRNGVERLPNMAYDRTRPPSERKTWPKDATRPPARQPDSVISITPAAGSITEEQEEDYELPAPNPCPTGMEQVRDVCMDRFEAPNREGAMPLVMFTMYEAEEWCLARGKRLCYDDEWNQACQGPDRASYPYGGHQHRPGVCNDDKLWRQYRGPIVQQWPHRASGSGVMSYQQQLNIARKSGKRGAEAADHIDELYQATAAGAKPGCRSYYGVEDLVGNVEEWVKRRDGGTDAVFTGRLKGRFLAEARTCQSQVSNHGNAFRFYEVGFRCCMDPRGD